MCGCIPFSSCSEAQFSNSGTAHFLTFFFPVLIVLFSFDLTHSVISVAFPSLCRFCLLFLLKVVLISFYRVACYCKLSTQFNNILRSAMVLPNLTNDICSSFFSLSLLPSNFGLGCCFSFRLLFGTV